MKLHLVSSVESTGQEHLTPLIFVKIQALCSGNDKYKSFEKVWAIF